MNGKPSCQNPWYLTTHRWGQTNLTEDDPVKCDLNFWRKQWKETKIQGVIVNCGGIVSYYPSKFKLQYRAKFLGDRDFFKEFSEAAREAGLKVVARMDINRASKEFYDTYPDWFCVDKDGRPITSQDRYFSCVNSDYYKKYIPDVLTEIIEKYRPEGFADNSWKGLGRDTICYCSNCRNKFKEECGLELPERVSWEDPVYREWIRWSYKCRIENWDLFNRVTQSVGGKDCLWIGMVHADPGNPSGAFQDLYEICKRSKIIFCDHQSRDMLNGFEQNSINGSLLRLASYEDILVPESCANYVRGRRTFRLAANPPEETRMWMIEGFAGGISPWYHHIGGSQNDRRQYKTPIPLFKWHAQNEKYLYNRYDLANVGLVWNQANADFYGRVDVVEKVALPWRGFCHALVKARIPFLPINASDIKKYSHRINTLILGDIAILSDDQIDAVCDFVDRGGNLVMTGITATLDGDGNPSNNDKLWKLLGLKLTGAKAGVFGKVSASWENYSAHSYFRLPPNRHEILEGFQDTDILPFGGGIYIVESYGRLKPLASYIPAFPIYPPEFSWFREERPEVKTIFAGELENGARIVYFAADIDRCFGRCALPDHGKLLSNAVKWAAKGTLPIKVEGPGYIDCKIYKQDSRIIVHLVNLSGCNRFGYCDEYYPVGPINVTINSRDINISRAILTVSDGTIPVSSVNGSTVFQIDRIADHEMIILE